MGIEWIDVKHRVPENRRRVLVYGAQLLMGRRAGDAYVIARFNPSKNGGTWDCAMGIWASVCVTHWAEMEPPGIAPPLKQP